MTSTVVDQCLEDGFMQARQLVGIHKLKAELISRMLSSSSQRLKIFSIWGAGEMGKTTLAKAVYDDSKEEFNCCAFVSVCQQPDMKKPLRDILIHLAKKRYSDLNTAMLDQEQLIDELQHFLKKKR
jgi:disease resistance protein RPM1